MCVCVTVFVMTQYIKSIDISLLISICHIVLLKKLSTFLIYHDIHSYSDILQYFLYFYNICYSFFTTLHDWKERLQMRQVNGVII